MAVVTTPDPDRSPRSRPPHLLTLLVVGAAAFGYLAVGYQGTLGPAAADPPENPAEEIIPPAERIPGFQARLVMLVETPDGLELVNWSPHAAPRSSEMSRDFARDLDYDRSLGWAGAILPTSEGPLLKLALPGVFEPRWFIPSSRGITSFAWHLTEPGAVAWVAGDGEEATLYRGAAPDLIYRQEEPRAVGPVPGGSILRAWGDWGFVLTRNGTVTVLEPSGRLLAEEEGFRVVTVGPAGDLLLGWTPPRNIGGFPTRFWTDAALAEMRPAHAVLGPLAWSPDGAVLAQVLSEDDRLRVRLLEAGTGHLHREVVLAAPGSGSVAGVRWSPDGFLVAHREGASALTVLDLREERATSLEWRSSPGTVVGLWVEGAAE